MKTRAFVAALGALAFLSPLFALAAPAVSPETVTPGERVRFTLAVTAEWSSPLTEVRLFFVSGVGEVTPNVKQGWKIEITPGVDGSIKEIAWSGGSIPTGYRDEFAFEATVKEGAKTISWPVVLRYADGSVVTWDSAPDQSSARPAPETQVANTIPRSDDWYLKGAFALSFLALIVAIGSVLRHF